MKRVGKTALILILGGSAAWIPSVVLHWVRGHRFSAPDVLTLTGLFPVSAVIVAVAARRVSHDRAIQLMAPLAVLIGVWLTGPVGMALGSSTTGGGFSQPGMWRDLPSLIAMFPLTTPMMATYDGSLAGLGIATLALSVMFLVFWTRERPPRGEQEASRA